MENPRLTFVTPTLIAGDGSLVSTVAHELAHSWSGNLVTNADWNDFWLNEGFTTYAELRIMERLYGRDRSEMLAILGGQDLTAELEDLADRPDDTRLRLDLAGRNPEDGMTSIAYEKGYLFLRLLEETFGRERWDAFLRDYFDRFAFEPMTTDRFVAHLRHELLSGPEAEATAETLRIEEWIHRPGIPDNAPVPESTAFADVEARIAAWRAGTPAARLDTEGWTTQQWLHFLRNLPDDADAEDLAQLDLAFGFTESGNAVVLQAWLVEAIERDYGPAKPVVEKFLTEIGRIYLLRPIYQALLETPEGTARAREIFARARDGYHALAVDEIGTLLQPEATPPS
jgi:hypothetical protein